MASAWRTQAGFADAVDALVCIHHDKEGGSSVIDGQELDVGDLHESG